jgi:RNA-directed DNA polymerase
METRKERKPAEVIQESKQAGDIRERWNWVEPSVWTDRMLTALEQGVKGGVWFSLIDKVWRIENLYASFENVKKNKGAAGIDHQTIEMYEGKLDEDLQTLCEQVKEDRYQPQAVRRVYIDKPGSKEKRPLGIPTVRDRVLQGALRQVLEPIFEKDFAEHSYGFRPNRGCKDALREVDQCLKEGYTFVVDADLKSYFDTIPHEKLMARIKEKVADGRILSLIGKCLKQGIMEDMKYWTPEGGTPQGAVMSPLLSNIYLDPLDHYMEKKGYRMIRYADDFVVLCRSKEQAERALEEIRKWVEENELKLHPVKTKIVEALSEGFDFLGYHFERGTRWPREKSLKKFKDSIRRKTRRTNGLSLESIIIDVNRTVKGWFIYFKHSHYTTFKPLDAWMRMRLRSILRKRIGLRGRGRGADHHRWTNKFFADQGLFSLVTAFEDACQSAKAVNH